MLNWKIWYKSKSETIKAVAGTLFDLKYFWQLDFSELKLLHCIPADSNPVYTKVELNILAEISSISWVSNAMIEDLNGNLENVHSPPCDIVASSSDCRVLLQFLPLNLQNQVRYLLKMGFYPILKKLRGREYMYMVLWRYERYNI